MTGSVVELDRARLDALLEALERMAGGDPSTQAPISDARDELDAIAFAVNVMAGELDFRWRELRRAQADLVHSGRMAALGQVSAGLAHELNNPLAIIRGLVEILEAEAHRSERDPVGIGSDAIADGQRPDAALLVENLARIDEQVERISAIIRHVRDSSRQSGPRARHRVAINEVVRGSFVLLQEQLRLRSVRVERHLAGEDPAVIGDRVRLEQVVVNVLTNAMDALEDAHGGEGGRLVVRTTGSSDEVLLEVEDDGVGIAPEVLPDIFTPFFTTKEIGRGTGLGLSISHGIVAEHGGRIEVCSRPASATRGGEADHGTRVTIRLPRAPS